jgi:hypothetical protein
MIQYLYVILSWKCHQGSFSETKNKNSGPFLYVNGEAKNKKADQFICGRKHLISLETAFYESKTRSGSYAQHGSKAEWASKPNPFLRIKKYLF